MIINHIKSYINYSSDCARWLLQEFTNKEIIYENFLNANTKEMRKFVSGIIYCAMLKVYPEEKATMNLYWTNDNFNGEIPSSANLILLLIQNMFDTKNYTANWS